MVVGGKLEKFLAHARKRGGQREPVQITQRHGHVGDMRKLGRRNGGRLKCLDQSFDFGVVRKLSRLQARNLSASVHLLPNEKKQHRANDRHDKAGAVKGGPRLGLREQTPDQPADD